ncbi:MAG: 5'/3'-nucleotidase SurE [Phycisphaerae bacterium]|nr:5'/3'-nucleotidase SurE [Phycisphaerae bacterium]
MRILLTNDDGIFAPGLAALYHKLVSLGDVTVAAPMDCWSGASHSITFAEPLACTKVTIDGLFTGFGVRGSPADCVKLAVMQLVDEPFDLVAAGINCGANVGINVYYSGTVAAAMEAAFLRVPSVAISVAAEKETDFDAAAEHGIAVLKRLLPLQIGDVMNINVPRQSLGRPRGVRVVPQATSGFHEYYVPHGSEGDEMTYLLSGGAHRREKEPADTMALADGYITVTPLMPDMTDHKKTLALRGRLDREGLDV